MIDYIHLASPFLPPVNQIYDEIKNNNKYMYSFGIASHAIKNGKYKNNKRLKRMKLEAVKNQFIDCKLGEWCKKINTIIKIKNKLITDYFKNLDQLDDYDLLMCELDKLLDNNTPKEKEVIEIPHNKEITKKINDMVLRHFSSFNKYLDKYKNLNLGKCKAIQEHTYFTKKGVYRFHSRIGREFYLRTGNPPFTIYLPKQKPQQLKLGIRF